MFITKEDLHAKMRESDLRQITAANENITLHACATAEGKACAILAKRFDTRKLFSATAEEREGILISLLCDIAIYEIVSLAQPNIDLTDRRERASQAVEYLNALAQGEYTVAWERNPQEVTPVDNPVISGGTPPRGNYF